MEAACPAVLVGENIGCESNLLRQISSKETNVEARQYTGINMEDIVENDVQSDCHCCSTSTKDNLTGDNVGVLVDIGVQYLQDAQGQFCGLNETSPEIEVANSGETGICQESGLPAPCEDRLEKCLSKSATFPSSECGFSHNSCVEEKLPSPCTSSSSQDVSLDQLPTYKRSVSLPAPIKLISAVKGGRVQSGATSKLDLKVKWASDVYDPPGSSLLPVIPSNDHGRPNLKKKDKNRHKHAKGKSVRCTSTKKKHANKGHGGGGIIS